jgi:hypothetical protein
LKAYKALPGSDLHGTWISFYNQWKY